MNIGVIGAGAWGTAFAVHLARNGHSVRLWVYEPDLCRLLVEERRNVFFLPGFELPASISYTSDLEDAARFSDTVVLATPSFALRSIVGAAKDALKTRRLLSLTKGLERDTLLRMSEVVTETLGQTAALAVLSGPSFADEVAKMEFTSVVVASTRDDLAAYFQEIAHSDDFRVYRSDDVVGVELGGALKNVMAIGAGILEGLGMGTNSRAAYVTRALAEMKRLGRALGARQTTFMGLSGIGDLILTCYGALSRNRRFGLELAGGQSPDQLIRSQKTVVEGYYTVGAANHLATKLGVDMPITRQLYEVLYEGKSLARAALDLKQRSSKEEDL